MHSLGSNSKVLPPLILDSLRPNPEIIRRHDMRPQVNALVAKPSRNEISRLYTKSQVRIRQTPVPIHRDPAQIRLIPAVLSPDRLVCAWLTLECASARGERCVGPVGYVEGVTEVVVSGVGYMAINWDCDLHRAAVGI